MLPLVVETVITSAWTHGDRLRNRAWPYLHNTGGAFAVNDGILVFTRRSLENVARENVPGFRRLTEPLKEYSHETICYLVLCGYAENAKELADECIEYMLADRVRLNIGYGSWSGGSGHGESAVSRTAIQAASQVCSESLLRQLEDAVIEYCDEFEKNNPRFRGFAELLVLRSIDGTRRSQRANVRISHWSASFRS